MEEMFNNWLSDLQKEVNSLFSAFIDDVGKSIEENVKAGKQFNGIKTEIDEFIASFGDITKDLSTSINKTLYEIGLESKFNEIVGNISQSASTAANDIASKVFSAGADINKAISEAFDV